MVVCGHAAALRLPEWLAAGRVGLAACGAAASACRGRERPAEKSGRLGAARDAAVRRRLGRTVCSKDRKNPSQAEARSWITAARRRASTARVSTLIRIFLAQPRPLHPQKAALQVVLSRGPEIRPLDGHHAARARVPRHRRRVPGRAVSGLAQLPRWDADELVPRPIEFLAGAGGLNTACHLARAGRRVELRCALGDDDAGAKLRSAAAHAGVAVVPLRRRGAATPFVLSYLASRTRASPRIGARWPSLDYPTRTSSARARSARRAAAVRRGGPVCRPSPRESENRARAVRVSWLVVLEPAMGRRRALGRHLRAPSHAGAAPGVVGRPRRRISPGHGRRFSDAPLIFWMPATRAASSPRMAHAARERAYPRRQRRRGARQLAPDALVDGGRW